MNLGKVMLKLEHALKNSDSISIAAFCEARGSAVVSRSISLDEMEDRVNAMLFHFRVVRESLT